MCANDRVFVGCDSVRQLANLNDIPSKYVHPSSKVCVGGDASTLNGKTADQIASSFSYGGLKYTLVEEKNASKTVGGEAYDTNTIYHTTPFVQFSQYVALQYIITANYTITYNQSGVDFTLMIGGKSSDSSAGVSLNCQRSVGVHSASFVVPSYKYSSQDSNIMFTTDMGGGRYVLVAYSYDSAQFFSVAARSCQYAVSCKVYGAIIC